MCSRGFVCVRGVWLPAAGGKVSAMLTNKIKIWLVRGYARDTPPPRHLLCKPDIFFLLFRLSIWLICEPLGETPPPNRKPPAGRTNRGAIHVTLRTSGGKPGDREGYRVYPGRTRSYGSVIFRICQHLFFIFSYF